MVSTYIILHCIWETFLCCLHLHIIHEPKLVLFTNMSIYIYIDLFIYRYMPKLLHNSPSWNVALRLGNFATSQQDMSSSRLSAIWSKNARRYRLRSFFFKTGFFMNPDASWHPSGQLVASPDSETTRRGGDQLRAWNLPCTRWRLSWREGILARNLWDLFLGTNGGGELDLLRYCNSLLSWFWILNHSLHHSFPSFEDD